ncbi:class I SAM-dependent methyltransferase [Candidatus Nitrospira bockiana]
MARPDVSALSVRAYRRHAESFVRQWGGRYRRPPWLREWLRRVDPEAPLLDLGCGLAQDGRALERAGYRVVGLDVLERFLRYGRTRARRLPLVQADLRHLPFGPDAFGGIWAAASLIHLPKPAVRKVLADLRDAVRPGAVLGATFVHGRTSGVLRRGWIPGRYISRWTKDELSRALLRSGWSVEALTVVVHQERRGRWLNVLARRRR